MNSNNTALLTVLVLAFIVWKLRDLFPSPVDQTEHMPELFAAGQEMYEGATLQQRGRILERASQIVAIAQQIADARGFVDDDEQRVYNALRSLRSRYELLLMSIYFPDVPRLFTPPGWSYDNAGVFLSQFLSDAEMKNIHAIYQQLPKYEQQ